jgi:nitrate/nitrite transporter NarK
MKLGNGQEQGRCRGPRVSAGGAFDGFTIPPVPGFMVRDPGDRVYAIRFVAFVFLALLSLAMVWILKYMPEESEESRVGLGPPEVS